MGNSHTGEGEKTTSDSNVVRLPRDWLGPRDQLVPFGLSEPDDPFSASEPDEPSASAPTASDFWGEGSANVQTAWRGPAAHPAATAIEPPHGRHPR